MLGKADSGRATFTLGLVFLLTTAGIVLAGLRFYLDQKRELVAKANAELAAVADLKARRIADWRKDLIAHAKLEFGNAAAAESLGGFLRTGGGEREIAAWLRSTCNELGFAEVMIAPAGSTRAFSGKKGGWIENTLGAQFAGRVLSKGEVQLTDLHIDRATGVIYMLLGVPIAPSARDHGRSPGVVLLQVDPHFWLYPYLATWPSPGRTAETVIMRRSRDDILLLSDHRRQPKTALLYRAPLALKERPVVRAFLNGERDAVRGPDYRGVPVVASFRPVQGATWMLMAKIDESEIYGPVRSRTLTIVVIVGLLIGFAALSVGLRWRVMNARFQQRQLEAELRHKALANHYSLMGRHARDVIVLCDDEGRILEVNDRAVETYGYSREEFLKLNAMDLRAPSARQRFEADWRSPRLETGVLFETLHCRKNGTEFPVEISRWPIEVDGRVFRQGIIRDISQRKRQENELRRVNRALRVLSDFNHMMVRSLAENELLDGLCRVLVDSGGYGLAWISLAEKMIGGVPAPESVAGFDPAAFREFTATWEAERLKSCPMTIAIRTGEPVIVEDLTSIPQSEIWRGAALAQGFVSGLGLPIWVEGSVYAALVIFSRELHSFSGEELSLLQELACDLAFGIEALRGRKRRDAAEAALHVAEDRTRRIFESLPAGMITCRANGGGRLVVTSANPSSGRLLGCGDAIPPGRTLPEVSSALDDPALEARLAELARSGGQFHTVLREVRGGWVRSFDVFCFQVAPGEAAMMFSDISERLAGEEALRRAHRLLDAVIESSPVAIVAVDSQRRIRLWNRAAETILGWTAAEALGRQFPIGPANDPGLVREITRRLVNRESVVCIEVRPIRKDGIPADLSLSAATLESGAGGETGFLLMFEDVSRRKQAESLLRSSEQRLEMVLEATGAGVWEWDIPNGRAFVNDRALRMLGYDPAPEGLSQEFWTALIHPEDIEVVKATTRQAFRTPEGTFEAEFRIRRPTGDYAWLLSKGRVVERDPDGRALRMIGTNTDITAHKTLEAQLNQALRIESIGRLAGGIAHDFNNLLTIINGFSELLLKNAGDDDPATRHLREIHEAGQRAAALTSQLLAVSRKQRLQPQLINLNDQVRDLTRMLGRLLGPSIHFVTELAADLPLVLADPAQISQVLMNLAVNGRDAMPEGGSLVIATRAVELKRAELPQHESLAPGLYAQIEVRDSGTGMSEETLAHIFEPFFSTKEPGRGTGLGLATVYGIVRQSGGCITVSSSLGRGSVFTILLPAAEQGDEAPCPGPEDADRPAEVAPAPGCILVVEDEIEIRRLARETLTSGGFTVLEAASGEDALHMIDGRPVDLLLADVTIPGLSGERLAGLVRAARPSARVLFISGLSGDDRVLRGLPGNGYEYLQKPFTPDDLLTRVREILAQPA
jgi:PAS domain S-box-containing protein